MRLGKFQDTQPMKPPTLAQELRRARDENNRLRLRVAGLERRLAELAAGRGGYDRRRSGGEFVHIPPSKRGSILGHRRAY